MEYTLDNGLKLIYYKSNNNLTSFSIALEAGAIVEEQVLGLAHATEHMVYKGTKNRTEKQINKELSDLFGFNNAMTNYPYVIYYGTLLNEDFEKGLEVFSDILINPTFNEEGFKEEMNVIIQELDEWSEDIEQYVEDTLFYNSYSNNRLKYPIIGRYEDLRSITREQIKEFYKKYYVANNTIIAVVSSLEFNQVKDIVEKYFASWKRGKDIIIENKLKEINEDVYISYRKDINSAKAQIIFDISQLTIDELNGFRLFNEYFGEGIDSLLFDELRTKKGLVYDVLTTISSEKNINLYKITLSTNKSKMNEAINIVNNLIENVDKYINEFTNGNIQLFTKKIKVKKLLNEEKSIQLAKELSTYSVMYKKENVYNLYYNVDKNVSKEYIIDCAKKVFKHKSIQIVYPKDVDYE